MQQSPSRRSFNLSLALLVGCYREPSEVPVVA